jgi:hypothetical protein
MKWYRYYSESDYLEGSLNKLAFAQVPPENIKIDGLTIYYYFSSRIL